MSGIGCLVGSYTVCGTRRLTTVLSPRTVIDAHANVVEIEDRHGCVWILVVGNVVCKLCGVVLAARIRAVLALGFVADLWAVEIEPEQDVTSLVLVDVEEAAIRLPTIGGVVQIIDTRSKERFTIDENLK